VHLGRRNSCPDEDAVGAIVALEVARQRVQLGEPGALGIGDEQLDIPKRFLKGRGNPVTQLVEAFARLG
jgi:nanoRNase/pAp phosphatase (c-di-AMP/oligoRNAs hydrolase)